MPSESELLEMLRALPDQMCDEDKKLLDQDLDPANFEFLRNALRKRTEERSVWNDAVEACIAVIRAEKDMVEWASDPISFQRCLIGKLENLKKKD